MPIYEQALTDLVEVTDLPGGVSLLTFAWVTRNTTKPGQRTPEALYAATSEVREIVAANPGTIVSSLADEVTAYTALRRTGPVEGDTLPDIFNRVPWSIAVDMKWRERGGLPSLFVPATELGTDVNPADLLRINYSTGEITPFGSDTPVTRPMLLDGPSADEFDLPKAADILAAHPWVLALHYYKGLTSGGDHNAPALRLVVKVPQDVYDRIREAREYVSGHMLDEVLIWAAKSPTGTSAWMALGGDPLGLHAALRTTAYPNSENYYSGGETFPDLAERYPSVSDTYQS